MRGTIYRGGLGIALFFLIAGLLLFTVGSRALLAVSGFDDAVGAVNGTLRLIGAIWAGVGGLLVLLFLLRGGLGLFRRSVIDDGLTALVEIAETPWAHQSPAGADRGDVADALSKLAALAKDGLLSPDEWEQAKDLYLGKPESRRDADVRLLRELNDLHDNGVLSESEFNTKKWEILSRS